MISSVANLIRKHEGLTLEARPDAKGKWAIGYGHDIPPNPGFKCTIEQADEWFGADLALATLRAKSVLGSAAWAKLDPVRQAALTDMAYELGGEGLSGFVWMLAAIRAGVWEEAKRQALASTWAQQVPERAAEDAEMLLTGNWPP